MTTKMCQKCNKHQGGYFCTACGTELVPMPNCVCGVELWPHEDFCKNCGRSRQKALSPSKPLTPPPPTSLWGKFWRWLGEQEL